MDSVRGMNHLAVMIDDESFFPSPSRIDDKYVFYPQPSRLKSVGDEWDATVRAVAATRKVWVSEMPNSGDMVLRLAMRRP